MNCLLWTASLQTAPLPRIQSLERRFRPRKRQTGTAESLSAHIDLGEGQNCTSGSGLAHIGCWPESCEDQHILHFARQVFSAVRVRQDTVVVHASGGPDVSLNDQCVVVA